MHKFRTVRFSYLYIFAGSVLLSAAFLFVIQKVISLIYSHYSGHSGVLFVRLIHWIINHVGTTPCVLLLFVMIFYGLYILRSQKIADDLQTLRVASVELAEKGRTQDVKVLSGGELGEMAKNLNRIHKVDVSHRVKDDTESIALLMRTRGILRTLCEVEEMMENKVEPEIQKLLAAVNSEVRSMEQVLENLIIGS